MKSSSDLLNDSIPRPDREPKKGDPIRDPTQNLGNLNPSPDSNKDPNNPLQKDNSAEERHKTPITRD